MTGGTIYVRVSVCLTRQKLDEKMAVRTAPTPKITTKSTDQMVAAEGLVPTQLVTGLDGVHRIY